MDLEHPAGYIVKTQPDPWTSRSVQMPPAPILVERGSGDVTWLPRGYRSGLVGSRSTEAFGEPTRMFVHDVIIVPQQPSEVFRAQLNLHSTAEKIESLKR